MLRRLYQTSYNICQNQTFVYVFPLVDTIGIWKCHIPASGAVDLPVVPFPHVIAGSKTPNCTSSMHSKSSTFPSRCVRPHHSPDHTRGTSSGEYIYPKNQNQINMFSFTANFIQLGCRFWLQLRVYVCYPAEQRFQ